MHTAKCNVPSPQNTRSSKLLIESVIGRVEHLWPTFANSYLAWSGFLLEKAPKLIYSHTEAGHIMASEPVPRISGSWNLLYR